MSRSIRTVAPVIAVAALLALSACGSDDSGAKTDSSQLDVVGRTFLSNDVTVNDKPYPLVKGSQLRLTFEDGTIGASAGCNTMGGDATWPDGVLHVQGSSLAMTEMGCDPASMDQDTWFADILTSDPTIVQDDTTLTLTSGDTVIVMTDEEVVVPDASLTGTAWQLDSIVTGETASSVPQDVTSTLTFTDNGKVHVSPGCNVANGGYSVDGDTITFERLATTLMACSPPASDVEGDVLGLLQGEVSYSIDGDSLVLTAHEASGDGASALVYRVS